MLIVLVSILLILLLYCYYRGNEKTIYDPKSPIHNPLKVPIIALYNNFASVADCKEIIRFGKKLVRPSPVGFDNDSDSSVRSSWQAWIDPREYPVIKKLQDKIVKITGYPSTHHEQFQLISYKKTQQYKHHLDSCNPNAADHDACQADARMSGGFREFTFLIYLNGDFTGGETDFPAIQTKVKPAQGRAVLFRNLLPGTNDSDPNALHAGLPVKNGTKWAINVWIRNGPYLPNL